MSNFMAHVRRPQEEPSGDFSVGCLYEDCRYRPVLCTEIQIEDGDAELKGIDLVSGHLVAGCSVQHCGPKLIAVQDVVELLSNPNAYRRARMLEDGHDGESIAQAETLASTNVGPLTDDNRRTAQSAITRHVSLLVDPVERSNWDKVLQHLALNKDQQREHS